MAGEVRGHGDRKRVYERDGRKWARFVAWVDYGTDDFGKRNRVEREFPSAAERDDWLLEQLATDAQRRQQRRGGRTVGQLLEDWYEEGLSVTGWSPRHAAETRRLLDGDLAVLAPIPLAKVSVEHAQHMVREMVKRKRSPHSIRRARAALSAAMNYAIRHRELPPGYNVASVLRIPRVTQRPPRYLDATHLPRFLAAIESHRLAPMFRVAMALGLRPGEAIGLRWGDVDLDKRTVTIRNTTQRQAGVVHDRGTKTGRERTIPLPAAVADLLREVRPAKPKPADRVFTNTTGGAVYETYANRQLGLLIDAANVKAIEAGEPEIPRVTFYQLRHTGATLLLSLGVPLPQVQEILGHSTIHMTRRYAQVVEPLMREAADKMDVFLRAAEATGGSSGGTVSRETPSEVPDSRAVTDDRGRVAQW